MIIEHIKKASLELRLHLSLHYRDLQPKRIAFVQAQFYLGKLYYTFKVTLADHLPDLLGVVGGYRNFEAGDNATVINANFAYDPAIASHLIKYSAWPKETFDLLSDINRYYPRLHEETITGPFRYDYEFECHFPPEELDYHQADSQLAVGLFPLHLGLGYSSLVHNYLPYDQAVLNNHAFGFTQVLLNTGSFHIQDFIDNFAKLWHEHLSPDTYNIRPHNSEDEDLVALSQKDKSTGRWRFDVLPDIVLIISTDRTVKPFKEHCAVRSYSLAEPDLKKLASKIRKVLSVSCYARNGDRLTADRFLVKAIAALCDLYNAFAVINSYFAYSAKVYRESVVLTYKLQPHKDLWFPAFNWVGFKIYSTDDQAKNVAFTVGMEQYKLLDIMVAPNSLEPAVLINLLTYLTSESFSKQGNIHNHSYSSALFKEGQFVTKIGLSKDSGKRYLVAYILDGTYDPHNLPFPEPSPERLTAAHAVAEKSVAEQASGKKNTKSHLKIASPVVSNPAEHFDLSKLPFNDTAELLKVAPNAVNYSGLISVPADCPGPDDTRGPGSIFFSFPTEADLLANSSLLEEIEAKTQQVIWQYARDQALTEASAPAQPQSLANAPAHDLAQAHASSQAQAQAQTIEPAHGLPEDQGLPEAQAQAQASGAAQDKTPAKSQKKNYSKNRSRGSSLPQDPALVYGHSADHGMGGGSSRSRGGYVRLIPTAKDKEKPDPYLSSLLSREISLIGFIPDDYYDDNDKPFIEYTQVRPLVYDYMLSSTWSNQNSSIDHSTLSISSLVPNDATVSPEHQHHAIADVPCPEYHAPRLIRTIQSLMPMPVMHYKFTPYQVANYGSSRVHALSSEATSLTALEQSSLSLAKYAIEIIDHQTGYYHWNPATVISLTRRAFKKPVRVPAAAKAALIALGNAIFTTGSQPPYAQHQPYTEGMPFYDVPKERLPYVRIIGYDFNLSDNFTDYLKHKAALIAANKAQLDKTIAALQAQAWAQEQALAQAQAQAQAYAQAHAYALAQARAQARAMAQVHDNQRAYASQNYYDSRQAYRATPAGQPSYAHARSYDSASTSAPMANPAYAGGHGNNSLQASQSGYVNGGGFTPAAAVPPMANPAFASSQGNGSLQAGQSGYVNGSGFAPTSVAAPMGNPAGQSGYVNGGGFATTSSSAPMSNPAFAGGQGNGSLQANQAGQSGYVNGGVFAPTSGAAPMGNQAFAGGQVNGSLQATPAGQSGFVNGGVFAPTSAPAPMGNQAFAGSQGNGSLQANQAGQSGYVNGGVFAPSSGAAPIGNPAFVGRQGNGSLPVRRSPFANSRGFAIVSAAAAGLPIDARGLAALRAQVDESAYLNESDYTLAPAGYHGYTDTPSHVPQAVGMPIYANVPGMVAPQAPVQAPVGNHAYGGMPVNNSAPMGQASYAGATNYAAPVSNQGMAMPSAFATAPQGQPINGNNIPIAGTNGAMPSSNTAMTGVNGAIADVNGSIVGSNVAMNGSNGAMPNSNSTMNATNGAMAGGGGTLGQSQDSLMGGAFGGAQVAMNNGGSVSGQNMTNQGSAQNFRAMTAPNQPAFNTINEVAAHHGSNSWQQSEGNLGTQGLTQSLTQGLTQGMPHRMSQGMAQPIPSMTTMPSGTPNNPSQFAGNYGAQPASASNAPTNGFNQASNQEDNWSAPSNNTPVNASLTALAPQGQVSNAQRFAVDNNLASTQSNQLGQAPSSAYSNAQDNGTGNAYDNSHGNSNRHDLGNSNDSGYADNQHAATQEYQFYRSKEANGPTSTAESNHSHNNSALFNESHVEGYAESHVEGRGLGQNDELADEHSAANGNAMANGSGNRDWNVLSDASIDAEGDAQGNDETNDKAQTERNNKQEDYAYAFPIAQHLKYKREHKNSQSAEARAYHEAYMIQLEAEARVRARAEASARRAKAKAEAHARAIARAEARAKAKAEEQAQREAKALARAQAKAAREAEREAKAQARAQAKAEREAQAKAKAAAKAQNRLRKTANKDENVLSAFTDAQIHRDDNLAQASEPSAAPQTPNQSASSNTDAAALSKTDSRSSDKS